MSRLMPAGERVASGRLRVDAARAVDKLRDHQLAERAAWVLEVIRAAIALGAERVELQGDGDDVWVVWEGPPPESDALARLFDELVDPSPDPARRAYRLLAIGVNTALGGSPRWVDVIRVDEGQPLGVRYSPDVLEVVDGEARGLRELAAATRDRPRLAPRSGGVVHLRRRMRDISARAALGLEEPAELITARRCCDDLPVPIRIGRSELSRARSHDDLLRVELEDSSGFWALTDRVGAPERAARLQVAELGVVLIELPLALPLFDHGPTRAPLRLYLDAPRMPTNASRGGVRRDEAPLVHLLQDAEAALPTLIEAVARELGPDARAEWIGLRAARLRDAALSLLAAVAGGARWRSTLRDTLARGGNRPLTDALRRLAERPILEDALGRPRAPLELAPGFGEALVHEGEPVHPRFEPWLSEVVRAPRGDAARLLFGDFVPESAATRMPELERWRARREAWLALPARPPRVAETRGELARVPLRPTEAWPSAVGEDRFSEQLEGELVLLAPSPHSRAEVSYRRDGRELELIEPELHLPVAAAVEGPFEPTPDYSGVERDAIARAASRAIEAAAIVAGEVLATHLLEREAPPGALSAEAKRRPRLEIARLVKRAIRQLVRASSPAEIALLAASKSPLFEAPLFPDLEGEAHSANALREAAQGGAALRVIPPGGDFALPEGAPSFLRVAPADRAFLRAFTEGTVVTYDPEQDRWPDASALRHLLGADDVGLIRREKSRVAIVIADRSGGSIFWHHFGRRVSERSPRSAGGVRIVIDDATLVPNATRTALEETPRPAPWGTWRRELVEALMSALEGRPPPDLVTPSGAGPPELAAHLLDLVSTMRGRSRIRGRARMSSLPLIAVYGEPELISTDALAERFEEGPIPFLTRSPPAGQIDDWGPAILHADWKQTVEALTERELYHADREVEAETKRTARARGIARLLEEAPRDWARLFVPAPAVEVKVGRFGTMRVGLGTHHVADIDVSIEARPFTRERIARTPPVQGVADLNREAVDDRVRNLGPGAKRALKTAIDAGSRRILEAVSEEDPPRLFRDQTCLAVLTHWVEEAASRRNRTTARARERILDAPAHPSVAGPLVSLRSAVSGQTLRIAEWDEPWLGPEEGENESSFDAPVLRVPSDEKAREARRALLTKLWLTGRVVDVTGRIRRLQNERRVARGLVRAPRLRAIPKTVRPTIDPRVVFPIGEVGGHVREVSDVLGLGEVTLIDADESQIFLFEGELIAHTLRFSLVPAVAIAAGHASARPGGEVDAKGVEAALRVIIGRTIRRALETVPGHDLPEWLRRRVLSSALHGGAPHFEPIMEVPIFPTSLGGWVAPAEVEAQRERFGEVWWTPEEGLEPLDPDRVALHLDQTHGQLLPKWIPSREATEDLRLDAQARRNLARPLVDEVEVPEAIRARALRVREFTRPTVSRGQLALLAPRDAHEAGLHIHIDRRFYEVVEDAFEWPVRVHVDAVGATPNRTHSGVVRDVTYRALLQAVRSEAKTAARALVGPPPDTLAHTTVAQKATNIAAAKKERGSAAAIGVAWVERSLEPGRISLSSELGEETVRARLASGRALPIHAELFTLGGPAVLRAVLHDVAAALAAQLNTIVAEAADEDALAIWLDLFASGVLNDPPAALLLSLEGALATERLEHFEPAVTIHEVGDRLREGHVFGFGYEADRGAVRAAELDAPVLIESKTLLSRALRTWIGTRARPWRELLREAQLGVDAALVREIGAPPFAAVETHGEMEADVPPAAPSPRAEGALALALGRELEAWGLGRVFPRIRHGRGRRFALVSGPRGLEIGGHHPSVESLEASLTGGADDAPERLALFALHAVGIARRTGAIGVDGELALIARLLER